MCTRTLTFDMAVSRASSHWQRTPNKSHSWTHGCTYTTVCGIQLSALPRYQALVWFHSFILKKDDSSWDFMDTELFLTTHCQTLPSSHLVLWIIYRCMCFCGEEPGLRSSALSVPPHTSTPASGPAPGWCSNHALCNKKKHWKQRNGLRLKA